MMSIFWMSLSQNLAPFYIMDRAYVALLRLYILTQCLAFFVIRAKANLQFRRLYSHPIDKSTGLKCDQTIVLTGINSAKEYPEKLRRIRFYDKDNNLNLTFLTNNFGKIFFYVQSFNRIHSQRFGISISLKEQLS